MVDAIVVAVAAVFAVAPEETKVDPEHFAEWNTAENLHSNFAEHVEGTVAVAAADTAAASVVDTVSAVLVEAARLTFAVELSVVVEPTELAEVVDYAVELAERSIAIVAVEWVFETVVIASELDFASVFRCWTAFVVAVVVVAAAAVASVEVIIVAVISSRHSQR